MSSGAAPHLASSSLPHATPLLFPPRLPQAWDQNVFNEVAHDGMLPLQKLPGHDRLVYAANQSLAVRARACWVGAADGT